MADCDSLFKEFNGIVKLAKSYKSSLRTSRDALRAKVREKFRQKGYEVKFHRQGSFAMNTIIKPKDGDYDIDDGIYILVAGQPKEAIQTLHDWVLEAAEDHTRLAPQDRNPCVRVGFSAGHHIDLVIYHKIPYDHPRLAHRRDGWIVSDPKEFAEWFDGRADAAGQLKRLVRYFKAWKDNLRGEMPSGLILTILAANNVVHHERDDVAFLETMRAIRGTLGIYFACYRPTTPHEDLFAGYSATRRQYFMGRLDAFIASGDQAMSPDLTQKQACAKWKWHFGDRFPCYNAKDELEGARQFSRMPFIRTDGHSADAD